jgi:hypothetical protein
MRRWLVSLLCLVLANTAWSQSTMPQSIGKNPTAAPSGASGNVPVGQPICGPGGCAAGASVKTICVSEPAKRIKVSIAYTSVDEKVCYPSCGWSFLGLWGCGQGGCSTPYTKRVLVKKFVETEETYNKCVAVTTPCATNRLMPAAANSSPYLGQPTFPESIPIPPVPIKKGN